MWREEKKRHTLGIEIRHEVVVCIKFVYRNIGRPSYSFIYQPVESVICHISMQLSHKLQKAEEYVWCQDEVVGVGIGNGN